MNEESSETKFSPKFSGSTTEVLYPRVTDNNKKRSMIQITFIIF